MQTKVEKLKEQLQAHLAFFTAKPKPRVSVETDACKKRIVEWSYNSTKTGHTVQLGYWGKNFRIARMSYVKT